MKGVGDEVRQSWRDGAANRVVGGNVFWTIENMGHEATDGLCVDFMAIVSVGVVGL